MIALALTAVLTATAMVPPGGIVTDHSQPSHWTQPTIRRFEYKSVDDQRRAAWNHLQTNLDKMWADYANDPTPEKWEAYKAGVRKARAAYIYQDPHYAPVIN